MLTHRWEASSSDDNIVPRNLAANLAQMAHPAIGFFTAEDRVLVVSQLCNRHS
jgi:hypothetical protein